MTRPRPAAPRLADAATLEAEIAWFARVLDLRVEVHAGVRAPLDPLDALPPPPLAGDASPYAAGVAEAGLAAAERLVLILALMPHLRPQALDSMLAENATTRRRFTEFGGTAEAGHGPFRPTRETALFLLAGEVLALRLRHTEMFHPDAPLGRLRVLEPPPEGMPGGGGVPLAVVPRWRDRLLGLRPAPPGADFPAEILATPYRWRDLVLDRDAQEEVEAIVAWAEAERRLMVDWGLARHLKPGYRALFYGPPGTGKTMTAALLGQRIGRPVYRIDLSRVVSKYIGETEKNLGVLFDAAADGEMVLFFDEADALFGARGGTSTANDRHANQQVAYLLQRIEASPGIVILASNLRANIDPAFARRFQATVHFPAPDAEARLRLWRSAFKGRHGRLAAEADLAVVARESELAGGAIVNVLRFAALRAASRGEAAVSLAELREGAARELRKEGRLG